jgi:GNAT superfamily N-acetyltransferase
MRIEIKKCGAEQIGELYELTRAINELHSDLLGEFSLTKERLSELVTCGAVQSYIAYADGNAAAHINFFYKYTTFSGRKIIYLEDLYVREEYRRLGLGRRLMDFLKQIGRENDCERIEWKCADFNKDAEVFYGKIGGTPDRQWQTYSIERSDF